MNEPAAIYAVEARPEPFAEDVFPAVAGGIIGAAAADALGWITEFVRGRDHLLKIYRTDYVSEYRSWQKTTGGRFNAYVDYISKGEYSDDTQLTLAVARSLLADGSVDPDHFANLELPLWLDYSRGAGSTIMGAARALKGRKSTRWNNNFFGYKHRGDGRDYRSAGANGAAMRIGPIALANIKDAARMALGVWKTSAATHGHPRALLGALIHAEALRRCAGDGDLRHGHVLLAELGEYVRTTIPPNDEGIMSWLAEWDRGSERPFSDLWEATRAETLRGLSLVSSVASRADLLPLMKELGCFDRETKGSGIATVLAGLAIFLVLGDDFREAVLFAVNALGSDTDTIGGFVGGLCGAAHGYGHVDHNWASELQDYEYFMRIATEVARIVKGAGMGGRALLPERNSEQGGLPDLVQRLKDHDVAVDERVYHPLFGAGWVKAVDAQNLRRRDGAQVVFARVTFDIGQTCKFRYMQVPGSAGRLSGRATQVESSGQEGLFA
ncbi:MAG: ADP-ribosylglycohydrolase family protein [Actinomycetota bacterium]